MRLGEGETTATTYGPGIAGDFVCGAIFGLVAFIAYDELWQKGRPGLFPNSPWAWMVAGGAAGAVLKIRAQVKVEKPSPDQSMNAGG
jgi:hypothetical protein